MRRLLGSFPLLLVPIYAVAACDTTDSGTLQLVTGEETDTFTASPAPATLTVYAIDGSGNVTTLADAGIDATDLDLGDQNENNSATIEVLGNTASGANVVAGASLALEYGALASATLPVFVQRTYEWARLPSPPTDARQFPTLAIISGEFLFIGGGNGGTTAGETIQLYDFAPLSPVSNPTTLPLVPLSMPVVGTVGLLLGQGAAAYWDFSQNVSASVSPPSNAFSFDDVAGGQVIYDVDGTGTVDYVFVVGATRTTGTPTQAVLEIVPTDTSNANYPSGNLHWLSLTQPRLGAAAAWIAGEGLVVIGGNSGGGASGDAGADSGAGTGAGVELFAQGSTGANFSALSQFPFDPSTGAGAVAWQDTQHVLVAGGLTPTGQDPGIRVFDLSCSAGSPTCIATWGSGLPIALTGASTFVVGTGITLPDGGAGYPAIVVGNELQSGLTHSFLLNSSGATELHTKVAHYNASAIQSPLGFGSILLFGGADEIESFFPPQSPPG